MKSSCNHLFVTIIVYLQLLFILWTIIRNWVTGLHPREQVNWSYPVRAPASFTLRRVSIAWWSHVPSLAPSGQPTSELGLMAMDRPTIFDKPTHGSLETDARRSKVYLTVTPYLHIPPMIIKLMSPDCLLYAQPNGVFKDSCQPTKLPIYHTTLRPTWKEQKASQVMQQLGPESAASAAAANEEIQQQWLVAIDRW